MATERPNRPGGKRASGDRPARRGSDDRPSFNRDRAPRDNDRAPRGASDRPERSYGDRPTGGYRKDGSRATGDRKPRGNYNRDDRPSFGGDRSERPSYGDRKPSGDRPYGERKSYGDRPSGERKSYGDRPSFGGDRKPRGEGFGSDRPFNRDRGGDEKRPYGERKPFNREGGEERGERKSYGDRPSFGDRKPGGFRKDGDRPAYSDRKPRGEGFGNDRPSFGDKKPRGNYNREDRPSFGGDRSERPSYGDRKSSGDRPYGERKSYGDRPSGERKSFGDRPSFGDRKPYEKPAPGDRSGRYGQRTVRPGRESDSTFNEFDENSYREIEERIAASEDRPSRGARPERSERPERGERPSGEKKGRFEKGGPGARPFPKRGDDEERPVRQPREFSGTEENEGDAAETRSEFNPEVSEERPRSAERERPSFKERERERNAAKKSGRSERGNDREEGRDNDRNRYQDANGPRNFGTNLGREKEEKGPRKFDSRKTGPEAPDYDLERFERREALKNKEAGDERVRLNRYIANAGVCSRREADELIAAGQISVNGEVVTEMGHLVNPGDTVMHGKKKLNREKYVYVLLNKPKDFITTTEDPEERKTVMQLVANATKERVFPVGRLDRNTTGLLLFTNDGELAHKLTHPSNHIPKVYQAELDKPFEQGHMQQLLDGVELEDGPVIVDEAAIASPDRKVVGLEIHLGRNRIVRRLFEHLGYEVERLDRVSYAGLTKKDLPRGNWRFLTEKEVIRLKYFI